MSYRLFVLMLVLLVGCGKPSEPPIVVSVPAATQLLSKVTDAPSPTRPAANILESTDRPSPEGVPTREDFEEAAKRESARTKLAHRKKTEQDSAANLSSNSNSLLVIDTPNFWWFHCGADGSGSMGYGAGVSLSFKAGTIDFKAVVEHYIRRQREILLQVIDSSSLFEKSQAKPTTTFTHKTASSSLAFLRRHPKRKR